MNQPLTCGNCRFWTPGRTMRAADNSAVQMPGACRRYPPAATRPHRPLTESGDWCGEHSQLAESPAGQPVAAPLPKPDAAPSTGQAAGPAGELFPANQPNARRGKRRNAP